MASRKMGFTIVELLVVIVVIGILASVTVVAYSGIQSESRLVKVKSDLEALSKAVIVSRTLENKTMLGITGQGYTAAGCMAKSAGTDLAALSKADACWSTYLSTLDKLSIASNINVRNLVDPWGRPYYIDENEGEGGTGCGQDYLTVYSYPFNGSANPSYGSIRPPLTGYSGCAI